MPLSVLLELDACQVYICSMLRRTGRQEVKLYLVEELASGGPCRCQSPREVS